MFDDEDELLFGEDDEGHTPTPEVYHLKPWRILVVDDEEEIHTVTSLVLSRFSFMGRDLDVLDAYSAEEAKKIMTENDDIAVALIDVVMEHDQAGLDLVRYIRDDLNNNKIRLILRTGQAGQAPEERVIEEYDINDYKEKTELTSLKLRTLLYSSLRSYRDLMSLELNRKGLMHIIQSSTSLYDVNNLHQFASAVLLQLVAVMGLGVDAAYVKVGAAFAAKRKDADDQFDIMAATGDCSRFETEDHQLAANVIADLKAALQQKKTLYFDSHLVIYFSPRADIENLLYLTDCPPLDELDKELIDTFCSNMALAFDHAGLDELL